MRLHATIADSQTDVEIRDEGSRVSAEIDARRYELDVHQSRGSYLLAFDGLVFECRIEGSPESGQPVDVFLGTEHYAVTLTDPKRLRGATSVGALSDQVARVIAPMPGKVVRVLVALGDLVEAGEGIVVVEAMKMQNEMKSPRAGTVAMMNVKVGATVNGGDVLAIVE